MALTKEQLLALPESQDYIVETMPNGVQVRHRVARKFVGHKFQPDDVLLFTDDQGERWIVEYHLEGGPYKRRAPF